MKVSKCSTSNQQTTYTGRDLEMTAPEGVYKSVTGSSYRYIVLVRNNLRVVLYCTGIRMTVGSPKASAGTVKFTRVGDAEVIFEINEGVTS